MYNLLTDPLVPVAFSARPEPEMLTLPQIFSRIASDAVDGFPGLAAHQAQAWFQFLAQLGALALLHGRQETPPDDPRIWRDLLATLTPYCADSAWNLVGEPTEPAFLQPPTARVEAFTLAAETPDALDVLVTAKNHDRKQAQAVDGGPQLWLYALIALQTTQGFSGRGNPGIARMNGGFSSRVLIDRRPSPRWGPRVTRAIRMLLGRRAEILKRVSDDLYQAEDGLALTWLRAWDTDAPLRMSELDPFFIEVCRRVRLTVTAPGRFAALSRAANTPRVDAHALKGNLGDPWVPINLGKANPSALTVSGNGFDYRLAQRILFGQDLLKPLALKPLPEEKDRDTEIHMAVLVRGQGKTEGLHERVIPLPHTIVADLPFDADEENSDPGVTLAELSTEMVTLAGEARKVLRQAILVYLQGPEHPNFTKSDATPVVSRFDRAIDEQFFASVFAAPEVGSNEASHRWQRFLRDEAEKLARSVWDKTTAPSARREKARAASEAVLFGGLRKRLPGAFPEHDSKETAA